MYLRKYVVYLKCNNVCYRQMVLILNGMMPSPFVASVLTKEMLIMILYWSMEMLVRKMMMYMYSPL